MIRTVAMERVRHQRTTSVQTTEAQLAIVTPMLEKALENMELSEQDRQLASAFIQSCNDNWMTLLRQRDANEAAAKLNPAPQATAPVTDLDAVPPPEDTPNGAPKL
jgi:hypothetical protein